MIILATFVGYLAIFAFMSLTEPLYNSNIKPWVEEIDAKLSDIESDLILWGANQNIHINNEQEIPELNTFLKNYPDYRFRYKGFVNVTVEELKKSMKPQNIVHESYAVTYIPVENGSIVVGVIIPEVAKWAVIAIFGMIVLYVTVQFSIIGLYVRKKARYLKSMAANLEVMAGGDLDIRVPIKGRDEMSQLASNINLMTSALNERIQKEKGIEETKQQLIANISHDLRTPLTAVMGYLSLLEEMDPEKDGIKMKQYIRTVHQKSDSIAHLVDQLFDYVLLSNRQMAFRYQVMEPSVLWAQLFLDSENILMEKDMQITYGLTPHLNIRSDVNGLKRVTDNLLQNIEKYGVAHSQVEIWGRGNDREYILRVINESEAQLDHYGDDFLNRYFTTDRISGKSAGLGLAISKEIIEQQGGTLKIITEGKRFEVVIALPILKEVT